MNIRIYNFIALVLLALFFLPYVLKVQEWDLIFILIVGLALPTYDFFTSKD
jgi:hypothetical protein